MQKTKHILLLIAFLLASLVFIFYISHENLSYLHFDSLEYAQIARNIAKGKGVCLNSYPLSGLLLLKQINHLDPQQCWPNFTRYHLTAFLLAGYFKIFGSQQKILFLFFSTWFFSSIIIFYLLSLKITQSQKQSFYALLFFIISLNILKHALFGALELLDITLFLTIIYLIYQPTRNRNYLLAGFVLGLAYLNRLITLFYLPILLVFLYYTIPTKRVKIIISFITIFLFTIAPLLYYNLYYTNNPFFSLQTSAMIAGRTELFPEEIVFDKLILIHPFHFLLNHPLMLLKKSIYWLKRILPLLPLELLNNPIVFLLSILFILQKTKTKQIGYLKKMITTLFIINTVIYSFFVLEIRYFSIFIPFIILSSVQFISTPIFQYRKLFIGILLFLYAYPLIAYTTSHQKQHPPTYNLSEFIYLKNHTKIDQIILGPEREIGWFSNRKSIPIPNNLALIQSIEKKYLPIQGIYICSSRSPHPACPSLKDKTSTIPHFYLKKEFESGALYFEKIP